MALEDRANGSTNEPLKRELREAELDAEPDDPAYYPWPAGSPGGPLDSPRPRRNDDT